MLIVPPTRGEHTKKYLINNINILPLPRENDSISYEDTTFFHFPKEKEIFTFLNADYTNVKPKYIASKLLLKQGDSYSFTKTQRSFENMSDLRYFRNINFLFEDAVQDSNLLNLNIQLTKAPAMNWGMDFEYINTSGLQGLALTASFTHRNIFKGGEILKISLHGGIELQILFNKKDTANSQINVVNNWDVGASVSLEFPRFLMPISHQVEKKYIHPKTIISSNFSYQHKTSLYDRIIINASIGYYWKLGKFTHQFFPMDLSIVKIYPTEAFQDILDRYSQSNSSRRLMYQYQDHFISATRYNLIYENHYSENVKNYDYARLSAEIAGNILCAGFAAAKAPKNDVGQYNIFGMPFSQYLRLEAEYRHYWTFSPYHLIAVRALAGFGYAYVNSKTLPYEKSFFSSGTNLIRAWLLYRLGPGSYYDSRPLIEQYGDIVSVNNIEYRFPIYKIVKGAAFVDFGNIWLRRKTDEFPKGEFTKNFYKDIAVGAGIGLRLDFDYFVIRFDAAVPLRDPSGKYGGTSAWMADKLRFQNIILKFGVGYPF
jgi:outer membrane protein assembly factor BamA